MSPETMTIAAPPANAEVTKYLMTYSADGGDLDPAKLYYNIYFDNDLFTFRKSEYTKLPEDEISTSLTTRASECRLSTRTVKRYTGQTS